MSKEDLRPFNASIGGLRGVSSKTGARSSPAHGGGAAGGEQGGEDAEAVTTLGACPGHDLTHVHKLGFVCYLLLLSFGAEGGRRVVGPHAVPYFVRCESSPLCQSSMGAIFVRPCCHSPA